MQLVDCILAGLNAQFLLPSYRQYAQLQVECEELQGKHREMQEELMRYTTTGERECVCVCV